MRGAPPRWRWLTVGSGILMAIGSVICACTWPAIFDSVLTRQLVLAPNSAAYKQWLEPSMPLYFDIYLFNWTNAHQFPEETPRFQELGPYRFQEHRRRVNISWHQHNSSVAYRTFKWFEFVADYNNVSLDDQVTTLDAVAASAVYRSRNSNPVVQKILAFSLAAYGHKLSVTRTAREFLFEGYGDALLDVAKVLPASMTGGAPPVDRFGWFYQRNNSIDTDGYVTVSTGDDGMLPGQILLWNHQKRLPYYYGDCSRIEGSVGEFMPRNLTEESTLTMFLSDLCRSVDMSYLESGEINGLQYHKFIMKESSFDNSSVDPRPESCYCSGEGGCSWGGVMNVSACRYGSPSFVSLPHFLGADGALQYVRGLNPDPAKHQFHIAVEPRLGVPLDVAARFQVNLYIEPNPNVALYQNVPRMLFPVLWIEERVMISGAIVADLRHARTVLDWGATVCASIGLFFAILVTTITCSRKKSGYKPPLDLTISLEKPKDEAEVRLKPI